MFGGHKPTYPFFSSYIIYLPVSHGFNPMLASEIPINGESLPINGVWRLYLVHQRDVQ